MSKSKGKGTVPAPAGQVARRTHSAPPDGGSGARLRGGQKGSRAVVAAIGVLAVVAIAAAGIRYAGTLTPPPAAPTTPQAGGTGRTAAIIDQLSLTFPNPDFGTRSKATLEQAGFQVDYFPGEQVSVSFYMGLAQRGYDVIVLRSHSARLETKTGDKTDDVALFTGEPIDLEKYNISGVPPAAATAVAAAKATQAAGGRALGQSDITLGPAQLRHTIPVFYDPNSGELPFFGLKPSFVTEAMQGNFKPGTVVILMGCDGLRANEMAEAFTRKGVQTFISWDHPVTAPHTDKATERLLDRLFVAALPVAEAVQQTMDEVGPDPFQNSRLAYYPPASGQSPPAPPVP